MEHKIILIAIFSFSLAFSFLAWWQTGNNTVSDIENKLRELPIWQKGLCAVTELYPYSLLNSKGKKWQSALLVLSAPFFISGYHLSQIIVK